MISIIVPVYNVEKYISKCMDSLISQTYNDIEIICVNDGSNDSSYDILKKYSEKDKRIIILNQNNQGLSASRNNGIMASNGQWIAFVDADDYIEKDYIELLYQEVDSSIDCVMCSYIRDFNLVSKPKYLFGKSKIIFEKEKMLWLQARIIGPNGNELRRPDKVDCLSTAWGKLYRTKIIKEYNLKFVDTKEIGTEDLYFNVQLYLLIKKVVYIPNAIYHYRKNNVNSLTSLYKPNLFNQWWLLFKLIRKKISSYQNNDFEKALNNRIALSILGLGLNETFSPSSKKIRYIKIRSILFDKDYSKAISNIDFPFYPIHWKFFFECAKHKHVLILYLLLIMIKKHISR